MCCHAHRVNCAWREAEDWYRGRLTIEPQTFLGRAKDHKDTAKTPRCVIITRSKITNKIPLLPEIPLS